MEPSISESLLSILIFTLLFRYLQYYWNRQQTKNHLGLYDIPFIGDAMVLIKNCATTVALLFKLLTETDPQYYGPCLGTFIKNPHDAELVMAGQKALQKDPLLYNVVLPFVGQGLVSSEVVTWKKDRKLISPSFSQKNTNAFFQIFDRNARLFAKTLKEQEGKGLFDVYHYVSSINLRTICETSLGVNQKSMPDERFHDMIDIVDRAIEVCTRRISNVWYLLDITYKLFPISKRDKKTCAKYHELMGCIMDASQKEILVPQEEQIPDDASKNRPKYLMEDLMKLYNDGSKHANQHMRDHLNTVVFAGYETSGSTIGFTLVHLGIYPEVQEKVYQEILDVVGADGPVAIDDLKNLECMERVIKETLRIFPVVPYIARIADEELTLSTKTVSAGSSVIVSILDLQRDPSIWPNPTKFDPDRFLPEETAKRHPYSFMPFSAGPRNCIGIRYAWMSMKLLLIAVLREYYIESKYKESKDIPMTMGIVTKPTEGHLIKIRKRDTARKSTN